MKKLIEILYVGKARDSKFKKFVLSVFYLNMGISFKLFSSKVTSCLPCNIKRVRRPVDKEILKSKIAE